MEVSEECGCERGILAAMDVEVSEVGWGGAGGGGSGEMSEQCGGECRDDGGGGTG
jgi:hypothetical protein